MFFFYFRTDNDNYRYLYDRLPRQCHVCGLRFGERSPKDYDDHLDIHFRKARRLQENIKRTVSRQWFKDEKNWITVFSADKDARTSKRSLNQTNRDNDDINNCYYDDGLPSSFRKNSKNNKKNCNRISIDECGKVCLLCNEEFETLWDGHEDTWMAINVSKDARTNVMAAFLLYIIIAITIILEICAHWVSRGR